MIQRSAAGMLQRCYAHHQAARAASQLVIQRPQHLQLFSTPNRSFVSLHRVKHRQPIAQHRLKHSSPKHQLNASLLARHPTDHTRHYHSSESSGNLSSQDSTDTLHTLTDELDRDSAAHQQNKETMQRALAVLAERLTLVRQGGGASQVALHRRRGKMLARERLDALCDPGAPFLELSSLAGWDLYNKDDNTAAAANKEQIVPSGGIVTGIGRIQGQLCMLVANDATVKGGTYYPITVKKHLRAQQIALENSLPCIYLVDSGGAHLPHQTEVFPDAQHFGRIFYNQSQMSARGIPQLAAVMGSCTAGGAYVPAMCDESIIVQSTGTIFLGGPPLVRAATGEIVTAEALGGAKLHCEQSGVTDHLAHSDAHALAIVRRCVANFASIASNDDNNPTQQQQYDEPLYDTQELNDMAPTVLSRPFDMYGCIARLVDGSRFDEFKQRYGTTLICGFARIQGERCGIVANNGILFGESALKGAHFIQLCERRSTPLVFLQNISGFMVGQQYEASGIAKNGAKLVTAVSTCSVPKFTVVCGSSFGAGNYGMCGRAFAPRLLFMWPESRIGVMGGEQAAQVMSQIQSEARAKKKEQYSDADAEAVKAPIRAQFERESSSYFSTARLWDDGIIRPSDTRRVLGMALSMARLGEQRQQQQAQKTNANNKFGIFRM